MFIPTSKPTSFGGNADSFCYPEFIVTDGDASQRNMPEQHPPRDGWYPLRFDYVNTISYLNLEGDHNCVTGNGARFIHGLGLESYADREDNAPRARGLAGNLAMLIGLIAFSCRTQDLDAVLIDDRAWRHHKWTDHSRLDGRKLDLNADTQPP